MGHCANLFTQYNSDKQHNEEAESEREDSAGQADLSPLLMLEPGPEEWEEEELCECACV